MGLDGLIDFGRKKAKVRLHKGKHKGCHWGLGTKGD